MIGKVNMLDLQFEGRERPLIFDGTRPHQRLIENLSMMLDHGYDIDEIYAMFSKWYNHDLTEQGHVIADYVYQLFDYSVDEEADDASSLITAMSELYKDLSKALQFQSVPVKHAAYYEETGDLVIILGN
jgi:hypothetical protein